MYFKSWSKYREERDRQPHHLFPDFSKQPLLEGGGKEIGNNLHVGLPYPVHDPFEFNQEDVEDCVKKLLRDKEERHKKLSQLKGRFKFSSKSISEARFPESKAHYAYMPKALLDFYNDKDADEDFKADYNTYYTGGVLDLVELANKRYLIRPTFDGSLMALDLEDPSVQIKVPLEEREPVCGLKCYPGSRKRTLLILRQKFKVIVLELRKIQQFEVIYSESSDIAVLDAKLNGKNLTHLGIALMNGEIKVIDVHRNTILFEYKNDALNNFQQLDFADDKKIVIMDEFSVKIIDYGNKSVMKTIDPKVIPCNRLCNFKISGNKLFLISRHYVMKTNLMDDSDLFYYSHSLDYAPCFVNTDGETFLCLSDHFNDYKVLFAGNSLYSLPHKVPGLKTTLDEARLKHPDILLFDKLDKRLNYSTAGIKLVKLGDKLFLYSTNCVGEIFRQEISNAEANSEFAVDLLADFIGKLSKPKPMLHVTGLADMTDAFFLLRKPIKMEAKDERNLSGRFLEKYGPMFNKNKVTSQFAKHFLDEWDSDDDDDVQEPISLLENVTQVPYIDKVNEWMDSRYIKDENISFNKEQDLDFLTNL